MLEARLLPKLDSRSQLTLAATNQALRHWLVGLPPAFWLVGTFLKHRPVQACAVSQVHGSAIMEILAVSQ